MLKKYAKRVYPTVLSKVEAKKYKILNFDGYFLLDDIKDGRVPNLFYHGKWRQTDLDKLTLLKKIRQALKQNLFIFVSKIEKINEVPAAYTFGDGSKAYFDFKDQKMICNPQQQRAISLSEFDDSLLINNIVLGYE